MDVFVSYSHKDADWKDRICLFLQALRLNGGSGFDYQAWDDAEINVGQNWRDEIHKAIDAAKVAVLLISPNFLTSRFILDEEVPRVLKRRDAGKLVVAPVIVRPSPWENVPWLAPIQLFPAGGEALSGQSDHEIDSNLCALCSEMVRIVDELPAETKTGKGTKAAKGHGLMSVENLGELVAERTGDRVTGQLMIFDVPGRQQVWLAASTTTIYCIIDDARNAASGKFIQWRMPLRPMPAISAHGTSRLDRAGLLHIGKRQNWLYSKEHFTTPRAIERAVKKLIETAMRPAETRTASV